MRLVLLSFEAFAAAAAVERFIRADPNRIALVGLSAAYRPDEGGLIRQAFKHLRRSGLRIFPYLIASFSWPELVRHLSRLLGRDRSLSRLCADLSIPIVMVEDVNSEAMQARIAASGADIIVTFHFDQILNEQTLAITPMSGVNVHAGLLPHHRGPAPTIHALLEDEPGFGVTIHHLHPVIDGGAILARQAVSLPVETSAVGATRLLHDEAVPLLETVLADIAAGRTVGTSPALLPYCGWPSRAQLRRITARGRPIARLADLFAACRRPG